MGRKPLIWLGLIALLGCPAGVENEPAAVSWALAIHGGAGVIPRDLPAPEREARLVGLTQALRAGQSILESGGASLDAVEAVIRVLEDDPHFNAGRGAVSSHDGEHELDASIMNGKTLACGAVAGVGTVKNPILLARRVMERTAHVLLAGEGAERFAADVREWATVAPRHLRIRRNAPPPWRDVSSVVRSFGRSVVPRQAERRWLPASGSCRASKL